MYLELHNILPLAIPLGLLIVIGVIARTSFGRPHRSVVLWTATMRERADQEDISERELSFLSNLAAVNGWGIDREFKFKQRNPNKRQYFAIFAPAGKIDESTGLPIVLFVTVGINDGFRLRSRHEIENDPDRKY